CGAGGVEGGGGRVAGGAASAGRAEERADCLGNLALVEALRGRLQRAATLAVEAGGAARGDHAHGREHGGRAAMVARAYVHLERNELADARRELKNAD